MDLVRKSELRMWRRGKELTWDRQEEMSRWHEGPPEHDLDD